MTAVYGFFGQLRKYHIVGSVFTAVRFVLCARVSPPRRIPDPPSKNTWFEDFPLPVGEL
jgi:hypothetical protein